jgi:cytochrome P450
MAMTTPKRSDLPMLDCAHLCLGAPLARVELQEAMTHLPTRLRGLRVDDTDERGVEGTSPFGVHGPIRLPLCWDPA